MLTERYIISIKKLLNRAQGCDIETKVMGISNHLQIPLIALEWLGVYLDFLFKTIYFYGINFTLSTHIEKLLQGCTASAFHALIRLSYGIMQPSALIDKALNTFSNYEAVSYSITK